MHALMYECMRVRMCALARVRACLRVCFQGEKRCMVEDWSIMHAADTSVDDFGLFLRSKQWTPHSLWQRSCHRLSWPEHYRRSYYSPQTTHSRSVTTRSQDTSNSVTIHNHVTSETLHSQKRYTDMPDLRGANNHTCIESTGQLCCTDASLAKLPVTLHEQSCLRFTYIFPCFEQNLAIRQTIRQSGADLYLASSRSYARQTKRQSEHNYISSTE